MRIRVIDSHTAGEPTRVVVEGGPPLTGGTSSDKRDEFRSRFDRFRTAVVNEPRGSDVTVGALLLEPSDKRCAAGVIFFNNVGYLGMCGHGTIGLLVTLAHLGRIQPGENLIETPVGIVSAKLNDDGAVSLDNVPSYRKAKNVAVKFNSDEVITGDVAWGGNWFFLTDIASLDPSMIEELTAFSWKIRQALNAGDFPEIDHIEISGRGRNF